MNEVFPTVSVDLELGKYVDDIDFDYATLTEYMRGKNFSDDEIADTTIHISKDELVERSKSNTYTTEGKYYKKKDEIHLYPLPAIKTRQVVKTVLNNQSTPSETLNELFVQHLNSSISELYSSTLVHEIEHKVVRYEGGMQEAKHHTNKQEFKDFSQYMLLFFASNGAFFGAQEIVSTPNPLTVAAFGILSIAGSRLAVNKFNSGDRGHKNYHANPEETRCREAETNGPTDLVQMTLKFDATVLEV